MATPHRHSTVILSFLLLTVSIPAAVSTHCTCDTENQLRNSSAALKLKLVAIASVLAAGALGIGLPLVGRKFRILDPENNVFFMIKAFAAGVILATGFIHVLPDAFGALTSPCLSEKPWGQFPFTGFVAMVASIGTLMVDTVATSVYKEIHSRKLSNKDEEATDDGHVAPSQEATSSDLVRKRIISQVLEVGIVVHSVIIGMSIGASESPNTIKPLLIALSFHQFFEGMGLGGCITQAKFESMTSMAMCVFFSVTTPIGIGVGIAVSSAYRGNNSRALAIEGVFNSASSGILIYMALVDLLAADFMSSRMQSNVRLQMGAFVSLLLGSGCMSFLAKWA